MKFDTMAIILVRRKILVRHFRKLCATTAHRSNFSYYFGIYTQHYMPWRKPGKPVSLRCNFTFMVATSIAHKYYILNMVARRATKISLCHIVKLRAKKVRLEVLRNFSRPTGPTTSKCCRPEPKSVGPGRTGRRKGTTLVRGGGVY